MIEQNLGFIRQEAVRMAKTNPTASLTAEDYEQEACIAMLRAAQRYEPDKGGFLTFAAVVIRAAMIDALRSMHPEIRQALPDKVPKPNVPLQLSEDSLKHIDPLDPYRNSPERICLYREQMMELHDAIAQVTEREQTWISYRFGFDGDPCTLTAAARYYGLGVHRAKHIERLALTHIRDRLPGYAGKTGRKEAV